MASGFEVPLEFVVSCGNAPPVLETAEHALDEVASFVGLRVERMAVLAGGIVGDDGRGAAGDQETAQGIAVIGGVGGEQARGWQAEDQGRSDGGVTPLPRCQFECDGTAATIDNSMDFCRSAAA